MEDFYFFASILENLFQDWIIEAWFKVTFASVLN